MNVKLLLHATGAFLFAALFIAICYLGLPVDFTADHLSNIRGSESISYGQLLERIANPLTPDWFYPAKEAEMKFLRPLQFFLMKLYFQLFHYTLPPFHVTAAAGFGLLSAIFFLVIFYFTRCLLWGWLAVIFYTSFPSNFFTMISTFSMDFQPFISLLSISSLALFGLLTFGRFRTWRTFAFGVLGWVLAIWLAIKLKSSEKILPFVCIGFLVLSIRTIWKRIGKRRFWILAFCLAALMFLVVPLGSFSAHAPATPTKDQTTFSFQWRHLLERVFYVPDEQFPPPHFPHSFSQNYGLKIRERYVLVTAGLFWGLFVILPLLFRWLSREKTGESANGRKFYAHSLKLILIWFGATIAGFANGLSVSDTRFLNFAYIPSIFLFFLMIDVFIRPLTKWKKIAALSLFAILIFSSSVGNFYILMRLSQKFSAMQDTLVRAERDVFRDFFKEEPNARTLYERHQELENRATFLDWYDWPTDWFEKAKTKLQTERVLYFYARNEKSDRLARFRTEGYRVILWKDYNFLDASPFIFHVLKRLPHKDDKIQIYRIEPLL